MSASILKIGSILFAFISWGLPAIAIMKSKYFSSICIIIFISMIFCSFSLFLQIITICNHSQQEVWSTLLDMNDVSVVGGFIMMLITILLNGLLIKKGFLVYQRWKIGKGKIIY